MGPERNAAALALARELRRAGLSVEVGDGSFRLKKSFEAADRVARHIVILGEDEVRGGTLTVKTFQDDHQWKAFPQDLIHVLQMEELRPRTEGARRGNKTCERRIDRGEKRRGPEGGPRHGEQEGLDSTMREKASGHDRHLCDDYLQVEYKAFVHRCVHASIELNKAWMETYRINEWPRWDFSLEECTLTFSQGGKPRVICDMRAVGSVQGDFWEWSWGNKNLPDPCKDRLDGVRSFGEEKEWNKLTSLFLDNDEYLGWELASVTVHLLGGTAVYRCPDSEAPGSFTYLVILSSQFVV